MERSKIKTTRNGVNSSFKDSKLKTTPKVICNKLPKSLHKVGRSDSYKNRRKNTYDDNGDNIGGIDTYNLTDTGTQVIELATPKVRTISKKTIKVTAKITVKAKKYVYGKVEAKRLKGKVLI